MKFPTILAGLVLLAASCAAPVLDRGVASAGSFFAVSVTWGDEAGLGVRSLSDDLAVNSVGVVVEDGAGTSIGSGNLTKIGTAWKGTLEVSATGPATFRAIARSSAGKLLYGGRQVQTLNGVSDSVSIAVQRLSYVGGGIQGQPLALSNLVSTLAGRKSQVSLPEGITSDGTNLYLADTYNSTIRKVVLATGEVTTLAGSPGVTGSTDGGGSAARFNWPVGLATDGTNLYVADTSNSRVRQIVLSTGAVSTLAGTSFGNLDGTGTAAKFRSPKGLALVGTTLYVTDATNHNVRAINLTTKAVTTIAGTTTASSPPSGSNDAAGTLATFKAPSGLITDGTDLYIADTGNNKIRKLTLSTLAVTTVAGSGTAGYVDDTGTAAQFSAPEGLTTDGTFLYVSDTGNHKIRKVALADGAVTVLAGGNGGSGSSAYSGDRDGVGTSAGFSSPMGIVLVGSDLYFADRSNDKYRKVTSSGEVTTVVGTGVGGSTDGPGIATFSQLEYLTTDGTDLFATDSVDHIVVKTNIASGTVTTLAGLKGSSGTADGNGINARFHAPQGITTDGTNLYVADTGSHTIRQIVISTGEVTTLAGQAGWAGVLNGQGTAAHFYVPTGITTDGTNLFVTDNYGNAIRKVVIATAEVTTVAGAGAGTNNTGTPSFFSYPEGITTDGTNLYTADMSTYTIRKTVIADGTVTIFAGASSSPYGSVDGIGTAARFNQPWGLTCDGTYLYVADRSTHTIRKIELSTQTVTTLAGQALYGELNGVGTAAKFYTPEGITTDGTNLYINDLSNHTIRQIH